MNLINKRNELAESSINRNMFELHEADARVRAFKNGWDACDKEYAIYVDNLKTGITSLNNKILEQAVSIKITEEKLNKAIDALEQASEYHNTDDVNGEAGYIAWKTLKEIKG